MSTTIGGDRSTVAKNSTPAVCFWYGYTSGISEEPIMLFRANAHPFGIVRHDACSCDNIP